MGTKTRSTSRDTVELIVNYYNRTVPWLAIALFYKICLEESMRSVQGCETASELGKKGNTRLKRDDVEAGALNSIIQLHELAQAESTMGPDCWVGQVPYPQLPGSQPTARYHTWTSIITTGQDNIASLPWRDPPRRTQHGHQHTLADIAIPMRGGFSGPSTAPPRVHRTSPNRSGGSEAGSLAFCL